MRFCLSSLFLVVSLFLLCPGQTAPTAVPVWGFFAHKLINKMAVFTLPQNLLQLYKPHLHYISEHAVDPDKRRFILKNEAERHYVDIDHWDAFPFDAVPRSIESAILKYGKLITISNLGDTTFHEHELLYSMELYQRVIKQDRYSSEIAIPDSIKIQQDEKAVFLNEFVDYGVLPYFFQDHYQNLVRAYSSGSLQRILKVSADIGHYLGDAHVPLHTTENYNGQLTNQIGIHAFWESRLPELFAESNYDFLVGKASYIEDVESFIWDIVLTAHGHLDEVLRFEKELSAAIDPDKQYCFSDRNNRTIWTQCPEFAEAYHLALDGMVEQQMQATIIALGSVWFSAWIDAGQPDLSLITDDRDAENINIQRERLDKAFLQSKSYGRPHTN